MSRFFLFLLIWHFLRFFSLLIFQYRCSTWFTNEKLLWDASHGCEAQTPTNLEATIQHIYVFFCSFDSVWTEAQRIFNLQIMSWFIAKNVSESWNVNWNLMLSRLKGNSQNIQIQCVRVLAATLRLHIFASMHAHRTCARIKSEERKKRDGMDWVAVDIFKQGCRMENSMHFDKARPRIECIYMMSHRIYATQTKNDFCFGALAT